MSWIPKTDENGKTFTNLKSIIENNSGLKAEELIANTSSNDFTIYGLELVAEEVQDAIENKVPIKIVGDFDADGIISTTILVKTLQELGANVSYYIPLKFTEGYGLSVEIVKKLKDKLTPKCLLITVDNGIASVDAIKLAKSYGEVTVIVLDHHLKGDTVPEADIIIDPEAFPHTSDFSDYCGAGLSLKLAEMMLTQGNPLLSYLKALSAIGTIADMVSLTGDNRRIVKEGLEILNRKDLPYPLRAMKEKNWLNSVDETTIGFCIQTQINAIARLEDDGASKVVDFLLNDENLTKSFNFAETLISVNNKRKEVVREASKKMIDAIKEPTFPLVVYQSGLHLGITGQIATELTKHFKVPSFVATDDPQGYVRGSARSNTSDLSIKEMMNNHKDLFIKQGGHKVAGGFSITHDNLNKFRQNVINDCQMYVRDDNMYYDSFLPNKFIAPIAKEQLKYAPFGIGNPQPLFKMKVENKYEVFGKDKKEHIKIMVSEKPKIEIIYFFKADEFLKECSTAKEVFVYGTIGYAEFKNERFIQIVAEDITTE